MAGAPSQLLEECPGGRSNEWASDGGVTSTYTGLMDQGRITLFAGVDPVPEEEGETVWFRLRPGRSDPEHDRAEQLAALGRDEVEVMEHAGGERLPPLVHELVG